MLSISNRFIYWGFFAVFLFFILWLLRGILAPFLIGAAIAYFLDPVVDRLEDRGLSRAMSTSIITFGFLLVFIVIVMAVVPILVQQMFEAIAALPEALHKVQLLFSSVSPDLLDKTSWFNQVIESTLSVARNNGSAWATSFASSLVGIVPKVAFFLIIPVVSFYFLLDWDKVLREIEGLLPREYKNTIKKLAGEIDRALAGFIRGQITVCLALASYYAVALILVGLDYGLLIGAFVGSIAFIPYVGALLGGVLAIGVALFQFWGDWVSVGAVGVVFLLGQFIEGNILSPKLVGKSVGVHPVWLIFSLSAFGSLFGFTGLMLALPLAATLGVLVRFGVSRYRQSALYLDGDEGEKEDTSAAGIVSAPAGAGEPKD